VDDGVTVIVMANLDDAGLGVDAISKRVADMFVPGTAVQGLQPLADRDPSESGRLKKLIVALVQESRIQALPAWRRDCRPPCAQRLARRWARRPRSSRSARNASMTSTSTSTQH
jgi:hypothetical protein